MPVLFVAVLVIMGSFAMLLPSIMYVLGNMGLSSSMSTPIIAVYSLAQFLTGPQWGRLSDLKGRKPVLAVALFLGSLSYGSMALFSDNIVALFLTMICAGLCAGSLAVVFAAVSDITDVKNRTRGMALVGAAIGLSFVIGTAIGGSVAGSDAASATMTGPATSAFVSCLLGSLLVALFMTETRQGQQSDTASQGKTMNRFAAFQRVARHPTLVKLCFLILAFTFSLALMEPLIPKYILVHFQWGPIEMRNVLVFVGVILVTVQTTLVGPLAKRFGEIMLVRIGLGLMGSGLLLLAAAPDPYVIYIALTFTSIGTAFFSAAGLSLASLEAADDEKGAVLGVAQSMQALGRSFGPLVAGALFDVSVGLPFFLGSFVVVVLLISFQRLTRQFHLKSVRGQG